MKRCNSYTSYYNYSSLVEDPKRKFKWALDLLNSPDVNDDNIIDVIDTLIVMVGNNIKYDYISDFIYCDYIRSCFANFFPIKIENDEGKIIEAEEIGKTEIDLQDAIIAPYPHSKRGAIRNLLDRKKEDFIFYSRNHYGRLYKPMNVFQVESGNHSLMACITHKKTGKLLVDTVDMTPLFDYVYTDGEFWMCKDGYFCNTSLFDYRWAVIYELSRIKYEKQKELKGLKK